MSGHYGERGWVPVVPTNTELAERAKGKTAFDVVRGWLDRHAGPPPMIWAGRRNEWLDWAARNFLADPEIRQHLVPAARSASAEPTEALREEIAQAIAEAGDGYWARADDLLALPAVRDLAVENRRLRETVERVRELADELTRIAHDSESLTAVIYRQNVDRIRRALDGSDG